MNQKNARLRHNLASWRTYNIKSHAKVFPGFLPIFTRAVRLNLEQIPWGYALCWQFKNWTNCTVAFTGALIYLLNLFCNSQNPSVREETAALFAKMITDKLVGPKVRIVLAKFLPLVFMDAMRDSAEASVHMFESKPFQLPVPIIWIDKKKILKPSCTYFYFA